MTTKINKFIFWTPRILSIILIVFLALFSLDVFDTGLNFWQTLLGLFMHNIPALILLIVLLISWKHEIVGGIVFNLAGLFYIFFTIFKAQIDWRIAISWSLIIALPAILIGTLFTITWFKKKQKKIPTL